MKNLFDYLEKKQKPRHEFKKSDEYLLYKENVMFLTSLPKFTYLVNDSNDDFMVMRANIIISALINKETFEKEILSLSKILNLNDKNDHIKWINTIKAKLVDSPYYLYGKDKIYIPFFTSAMNDMYLYQPEKLLTSPYDSLIKDYSQILVDPFDVYGANLYESSFTRLIKVGTDGKIIAFFHYDTNTIYFINDNGRLDHKIVLFDKYMKNPNYNHMLERVKPVVDAYFKNSRSDLLVTLHEQGLISNRVLSDILTTKRK